MDTVMVDRDVDLRAPTLQDLSEPSGEVQAPKIDFPSVLGMVRQKQKSEEAALSITCDLMSHI
ncbi:MAG: hypothetical protein G01um101438_665 [Parcubacteria group bacterium Gr01-1014_38]|nr:MAG: hypothetical protein G01um101438_665 [Parcubacteria group bacterium Gr01-1014_38]